MVEEPRFSKNMRINAVKNILYLLIFVFAFMVTTQTTYAATGKSGGRFVDENGNGINRIQIQYRQYVKRLPNQPLCTNGKTFGCCYRDPEVASFETEYCKTDSPPLGTETRDDPYDGTGPGWYEVDTACNSEYYIYVIPPLDNVFRLLSTNPVQALGNSTSVLGVSTVSAQGVDVKPSDCTTNPGFQPNIVADNVNVNPRLPGKCPTKPEPNACGRDCTSEACPTQDSGNCTVCTPSADGKSKTCQPPGNACNRDCSTQACPTQDSGNCTVCTSSADGKSKTCQPPSGPTCKGPCVLNDVNDTSCTGPGKPADCKCVPTSGSGTIGACKSCPSGDAAGTVTPACPAGGNWSASVKLKIPLGDTTRNGGSVNSRQVYIAEKVNSTDLIKNFSGSSKVSQITTTSDTVVIDRNLTGFTKRFERPGQSFAGGLDTPLSSTKSYVLLLYNGSETCLPIIDLGPVQDTCGGGACSGACDTRSSTCPSGVGNETCICVPNNPATDVGVCKPSLACHDTCNTGNVKSCQGVKDGGGGDCSFCKPSFAGSPRGTCEPPLACKSACDTRNPTACKGATDANKNDCSTCVPNSTGDINGTCQSAACNTPCDIKNPNACKGATDSNKQDCSACRADVGGNNTCQPPFNEAMCKCDGIDTSALVPGQPARFMAFGKVEGSDTKVAEITSMVFHFATVNADGTGTKDVPGVPKSGPIPVEVISTTPTLVRYRAVWKITIPANLDPKLTYTVFVEHPVCHQKTAQVAYSVNVSQERGVLAASAQPDFWQGLKNWICQTFNVGCNASSNQNPPSGNQATPNPSAKDLLQLKTLNPAKVLNKDCTLVRFKFSEI